MMSIVRVAVEYALNSADAEAWDRKYYLEGLEWDTHARLDSIALKYGLTDGLWVYDAPNKVDNSLGAV
jgi:hypothetical protein|tara:strand:+ start:2484 stop:2687 length:204 start_codon:yes stop_codon:yes gene_type:complete